MRHIIALAFGAFVYWCTNVVPSPTFWASMQIESKYIVALKIAAVLVTIIIVEAIGRKSRPTDTP